MYSLALGLVIRNVQLWAEIQELLRGAPFRVVADVQQGEYRRMSIQQFASAAPDIVLFELGDDGETSLQMLEFIRKAMPSQVVVAVHESPTVEMVIAALQAGANEFLRQPIGENLAALLTRLAENVAARQQGRAIAFLSAKGGCGASTIACHSAVELGARLAEKRQSALLIDLDLATGVARFIMKANSSYSVLDAIRSYKKLDASYWQSIVSATFPGLDVLTAPETLKCDLQLSRDELQHVVSFARRYYDYVLLDLGRGLGQVASAILPVLDEIYVVATEEITPLHKAQTLLASFKDTGYPVERVRFVLNRVRGDILPRDIERTIGFRVAIALPNDYAALSECYSTGRLLQSRSRLHRGIQSLVAGILGEPAVEDSFPRRILKRFQNHSGTAVAALGRGSRQGFPSGAGARTRLLAGVEPE